MSIESRYEEYKRKKLAEATKITPDIVTPPKEEKIAPAITPGYDDASFEGYKQSLALPKEKEVKPEKAEITPKRRYMRPYIKIPKAAKRLGEALLFAGPATLEYLNRPEVGEALNQLPEMAIRGIVPDILYGTTTWEDMMFIPRFAWGLIEMPAHRIAQIYRTFRGRDDDFVKAIEEEGLMPFLDLYIGGQIVKLATRGITKPLVRAVEKKVIRRLESELEMRKTAKASQELKVEVEKIVEKAEKAKVEVVPEKKSWRDMTAEEYKIKEAKSLEWGILEEGKIGVTIEKDGKAIYRLTGEEARIYHSLDKLPRQEAWARKKALINDLIDEHKLPIGYQGGSEILQKYGLMKKAKVEVIPEEVKPEIKPKVEVKPWEVDASEYGAIYHGGTKKISEIDFRKIQKRDVGVLGRGFYATKDKAYASAYGKVISELEFSPDAKILKASAYDPNKAPRGLVEQVQNWMIKRGETTEKVSRIAEKDGPWSQAVNKYAEANGYDAIVFTDSGEIVIKTPKAITKPKPPTAKVKEPWEMTQEEFKKSPIREPESAVFYIRKRLKREPKMEEMDEYYAGRHETEVRHAVARGDPVPIKVLKDYPDLAKPKKPTKKLLALAKKAGEKEQLDFIGKYRPMLEEMKLEVEKFKPGEGVLYKKTDMLGEETYARGYEPSTSPGWYPKGEGRKPIGDLIDKALRNEKLKEWQMTRLDDWVDFKLKTEETWATKYGKKIDKDMVAALIEERPELMYSGSPYIEAMKKYEKPSIIEKDWLKAQAFSEAFKVDEPIHPITKQLHEWRAAGVKESRGYFERFWEGVKDAVIFERIVKEYPLFQDEIHMLGGRLRNLDNAAQKIIQPLLKDVVKGEKWNPDSYNAFADTYMLRNLKWTKKQGKEIPGINEATGKPWTIEEVSAALAEAESKLAKYPKQRAALDKINKHFMELAKEYNLKDPNPYYVPHQVLEHINPTYAQQLRETYMLKRLRKYKPGFLKKREGSIAAIESDPVMILHRFYMQKLYHDEISKFIEYTTETYDASNVIWKAMNAEAIDALIPEVKLTWRKVKGKDVPVFTTPKGRPPWKEQLAYSKISDLPEHVNVDGKWYHQLQFESMFPPKQVNLDWYAKTPPEKILKAMQEIGAFNPELTELMIKKLTEKYKTVYLPEEIYQRVLKFKDPTSTGAISSSLQAATSMWKAWVLSLALVPFHLKNLIGDTENSVRTAGLKVLREVPEALKETYEVMYRGKKPSEMWDTATERNVINSGWAATEVYAIRDLLRTPEYKNIYYHYGGKAHKYYQARLLAQITKFFTARENVMRMATFKELAKKYEINIAAKKGREGLVDYSKFTPFEHKYMRGFLFPFYAFYKQNFTNWATSVAKRPIKGVNLLGPIVAAHTWNHFLFPELEKNEPDWMKATFHIKTPAKFPDGRPITIVIPLASTEALRLTGAMDLIPITLDLAEGNITQKQAMEKIKTLYLWNWDKPHKSIWWKNFFGVATPVVRGAVELSSGKLTLTGSKIVPEKLKGTKAAKKRMIQWFYTTFIPSGYQFRKIVDTPESIPEMLLESPIGPGIIKGTTPIEEKVYNERSYLEYKIFNLMSRIKGFERTPWIYRELSDEEIVKTMDELEVQMNDALDEYEKKYGEWKAAGIDIPSRAEMIEKMKEKR